MDRNFERSRAERGYTLDDGHHGSDCFRLFLNGNCHYKDDDDHDDYDLSSTFLVVEVAQYKLDNFMQ